MIFVTVGTHEQPFNRLVEYIDNLKGQGIITEEVIIQTGYSTYEPKYCTFSKLLPYSDMEKYVKEARIVITHGGPSSFIMPLQVGKTPIVVPRKKDFDEHVNDHQVEFSRAVESRMGTIVVVEDVNELEDLLLHYEEKIGSTSVDMNSNNARFNEELGHIVDGLFAGKKRKKK